MFLEILKMQYFQLGKWFSFKLVEAKKYRSDESIRARALIRTTAGNVNEVQVVPKETRVVNGEVEVRK